MTVVWEGLLECLQTSLERVGGEGSENSPPQLIVTETIGALTITNWGCVSAVLLSLVLSDVDAARLVGFHSNADASKSDWQRRSTGSEANHLIWATNLYGESKANGYQFAAFHLTALHRERLYIKWLLNLLSLFAWWI